MLKIKAPFLIETPKRIIGFGKLARFSNWFVWNTARKITDTITIRNYWTRINGRDFPRGEVFNWKRKVA